MKNPAIKNDKILDFLRNDVKSVIAYKDGKKEYQEIYNENGDKTHCYLFNEDESIRKKIVSTFQNSYKTGYVKYDEYDDKESYEEYELDQFGHIISKYYDGELGEQYQYNELGQIATVYYSITGAKDIYEYDENNMVIKLLSLNGDKPLLDNPLFKSVFGLPNRLTTFENDHFGNVIHQKLFNFDSKQLLYTHKSRINEQGSVIETVTFNADGSVNSETYWEYEYDHKNNWVLRREIDKKGNIIGQTKRQVLYYSEKDSNVEQSERKKEKTPAHNTQYKKLGRK